MAKMGRIVTLRLGKIDKKAMQRFLDDSLKGLIAEKEKANPKEFEIARKTLRTIQRRYVKQSLMKILILRKQSMII